MDPKLKAEQQQRAELERLAGEDPDSWAALAIKARTQAKAQLDAHKIGSPYLSRAIKDLTAAEALERNVLRRYKDKTSNPKPQPNDIEPDNTFTEALRHEHHANDGRPATTGTDPQQEQPATQEDQANGVLAGARDQAATGVRVATVS
jgi:hypothetical protein